MENRIEIRNSAEARRFLLESIWWQRLSPGPTEVVKAALQVALEMAGAGVPVPPLGFLADVCTLVNGNLTRVTMRKSEAPAVPSAKLRVYEDQVIGRLQLDRNFERASEAIRGYSVEERTKGIAFLVTQMQARAGFGGVDLSPAVIKTVLETSAVIAVAEGWNSLTQHGCLPLIDTVHDSLISALRGTGQILGAEDLFELERRTALAELGERVALRQALQAASLIDAGVSRHLRPTRAVGSDIATHLLEEDAYPVGGFSSLATRGSLESLLHSQLAYMEPTTQGESEPDLFDIKFLRDELLYYARDENQFHRRRQSLIFAFAPDLVATRFKDAELPFQRGILLLGWIYVAIHRLVELLRADSLSIQLVFVDADGGLAAERNLLSTMLKEMIDNGVVGIVDLTSQDLSRHCTRLSRKSVCRLLMISCREVQALDIESARLRITGARPSLEGDLLASPEPDRLQVDAMISWTEALERLLRQWI